MFRLEQLERATVLLERHVVELLNGDFDVGIDIDVAKRLDQREAGLVQIAGGGCRRAMDRLCLPHGPRILALSISQRVVARFFIGSGSRERRFVRALRARDTVEVLSRVFDRLYVLRNQLVDGGATWNSRVNRDQVRDGAAILAFLLPVFVDVMMDNPGEAWGRPFYPVVQ